MVCAPTAGLLRPLARQGGRRLLGEPVEFVSDQRLGVRIERQGVGAVIDNDVALDQRDGQRLIDAAIDKGVDLRLIDLRHRDVHR